MVLNLDLIEEQIIIQDTARRFAKTELEPVAARLDQEGDRETFLKNLRKLAELGLMGINVKSEYGGSEAGVVAFSLAVTEIARACASTAVTLSVNNMVCEVIQAVGSEEQKMVYIPKICSGEYYAGGFGLTETVAGSDAAALKASAILEGNEWVLNGSKMFITSAEYAGVFVVWAVTDKGAKKGSGISTFLVENGVPGLTIGREEHNEDASPRCRERLRAEDMGLAGIRTGRHRAFHHLGHSLGGWDTDTSRQRAGVLPAALWQRRWPPNSDPRA